MYIYISLYIIMYIYHYMYIYISLYVYIIIYMYKKQIFVGETWLNLHLRGPSGIVTTRSFLDRDLSYYLYPFINELLLGY